MQDTAHNNKAPADGTTVEDIARRGTARLFVEIVARLDMLALAAFGSAALADMPDTMATPLHLRTN